MNRLRGVLLDVDGTLVDSNDAHARAWVEALGEQGIKVPFEKIRPLIGMGGDKLLPQVTGLDADSTSGRKISQLRAKIFREQYLPTLRPTRGAEQLLRHLRDCGYQLAVASSAKEDELNGLLRVCGGAALIHSKTSADDAEHSKPDPDIVQAALKEIDLTASEAVLLGDSPYDIEAAERAGVSVIALRCGGWRDADLSGALAIYDDPADLLARFNGSVLAPGKQ